MDDKEERKTVRRREGVGKEQEERAREREEGIERG